jgi:glycerol-1-phosphate dehydrogenase [NAD(P)+]
LIDFNYQISGIKKIEFGRNLFQNIESLLDDKVCLLIADENTKVFIPKHLLNHKSIKYITLYKPLPHKSLILKLLNYISSVDLIIAIGSGTITDICKYLSYISGKDYIIFPTAPSVNAYTSPNASILNLNGEKISVQAKMPKAIYIDTEVIRKSPKRLILSGLYDLICSITVKLDCYLSHILTGSYYNNLFFELIYSYEKELIIYHKYLIKEDHLIIEMLMKALILSGFGMFAYGNSGSASQSEHIIAHALESRYKSKFFHGEYVAAGLLITSQIQEYLFKKNSKLSLNNKKLYEYLSMKKDLNFSINKEKWEKTILNNRDTLHYLIINHTKVRNFIINSNITLPKMNNYSRFLNEFSLKSKFTCLDLLYLCNKLFYN